MAVTPNRRPNVKCDMCSTQMYRRPSQIARQAGKFCSRACRNKAHPLKGRKRLLKEYLHLFGSRNPSWKGGVCHRERKGNYGSTKYIRCPPDLLPMARTDGYIMEHRAIMARRCRRHLSRIECVHHLDHDPKNNHPMNLELWPDNRSHKMAEHGKIAEGAANRWCPKG